MILKNLFRNTKNVAVASILKAIFKEAIDGIITIDTRGIVESLNPAAAKLFGYAPQEVIGKNISMLMPQPHQRNHDAYIENYQRTGRKKIIGIGREVEGLRKDGSLFPFRLSVSEVIMEDRRFYTGFIHDISDLKVAQERLEKLNLRLEHLVDRRTEELSDVVNRLLSTNRKLEYEIKEKLAAEQALRQREKEIRAAYNKERELGELKSRFVSMASHEFRTPLTTIGSSAALLARYTKAEQQDKRDKHITRIQSNVKHLTGILNDFLSLSRLEEGKVKLKLEPFSWNEYCTELVDELKDMLKPDQTLKQKFAEQSPKMYSDKRLIKHILLNIITNAIKYSGEGTEIEFTNYVKSNKLYIKVKDQGIGIPEVDQKYLFTRFFRANNVENIKGTGLGLTIVKRYLDLLGGTIDFESKEHVGTTFFIQLPMKHGDRKEDISH